MRLAALERLARRGDYAAFRALLGDERRRMYARAKRLSGDPDECVETATMFAFRRFVSRPRRTPLGRWMLHLLDEAVESRLTFAETCYDA